MTIDGRPSLWHSFGSTEARYGVDFLRRSAVYEGYPNEIPRTPHPAPLIAAFVLLTTIVGCRDDAIVTSPGKRARTAIVPRGIELVQGPEIIDPYRKDTPHAKMSDVELAAAVEDAHGRVVIGFREPGQSDGVSARGLSLTSVGTTREAVRWLGTIGVKPIYEFKKIPAVVADISPTIISELRQQSWVDYIEPDIPGVYLTQETPSGLAQMGFTSAWSVSTGSGVKVLILDSGTPRLGHRDLYFPVSWRCGSGPVTDSTDIGHGTLVAGVVGAVNNTDDIIGAAYGADIWMANIADYSNSGLPSASEMACAIDVARSNGVFVVNMSVGLASSSTPLTDQINGGYNSDNMLFVAAVGNDSWSTVRYPASLANVIGVTSIDSTNQHQSTANTGAEVELTARGVNVLTTSFSGSANCRGTYVALCTGTSLAAPYVTGAIAVLKARYPSWSNTTIRTRLRQKAVDLGSAGFDYTFGYGRLNVEAAIGMTTGVDGSNIAYVGYEGEWGALLDGGQSPFTIQWWIDGSPAGTDQILLYTPTSTDGFLLTVKVTDNNGLIAWGYKNVAVEDCGEECS